MLRRRFWQRIGDLGFRLRALFAPGRLDRELEDELRFHLEQETAKHRARGLSAAEARRAAYRSFGGVERHRELARDARGVRPMETLGFDLRQGFRSLRRTPAVSGAALVTVALAVGATTLIWAVVDTVLLRPLPYDDPERLVQVWQSHPERGERVVVSRGSYLDWVDRNRPFVALGAHMGTFGMGLTGEGRPVQVTVASVTPSLLRLLGAETPVGRIFRDAEGEPGGDDAVILSDGFWHRQLGGDRRVLGRVLTLDGEPYRVVGIMEPGFDMPSREVDVWLPMAFIPEYRDQREAHTLRVVGRLKPGVTLAAADEAMDRLEARILEENPEVERGWEVTMVPLLEERVGNVRPALLVLLGAVGVLLLAACVNVANLLLARGAARTGELAVRSALGAGRGRLVRQLLTESLLLALGGGALGALLAWLGLEALRTSLPGEIPRLAEAAVDGRVLAFALLLSTLTGLAFGALPAFGDSRARPGAALGSRSTSGTGTAGRHVLRPALVVVQVALALVLLAGAGLLARSFQQLRSLDHGFEPDGLLTVSLNLPFSDYDGTPDHSRFYEELLERVEGLPGVASAAATSDPPVVGYNMTRSFVLEGVANDGLADEDAPHRIVTGGYFRTLGIPLLDGRAFTPADRAGAPPVVMVNQSFVERHVAGGEAVGRRIAFDPEGPWHEIVGVVGDTRHLGLEEPPVPAVYAPHRQKTWEWMSWMTLLVRVDPLGGERADPMALADAVRAEVWALDGDLPLLEVRTVEEIYAGSLARRRFDALVVSLFAASALALGLVGLYGVMAFSVARRTREIGVRMALGARGGSVTGMVLAEGARLTAAGLVVGLAAALGAGRLLSSLLFGIEPHDPATFTTVAALLVALALLACWLPARRAARIDPARALQ